MECLFEMARTMARADSYRDRTALMKDLAEAALAGKCLDGKLFYISKSWYATFYYMNMNFLFPTQIGHLPQFIECVGGFPHSIQAPCFLFFLFCVLMFKLSFGRFMWYSLLSSIGCSSGFGGRM